MVFLPLGLWAAGPAPALAQSPAPGPAKPAEQVVQAQHLTQPGSAEPEGLKSLPLHTRNYPASAIPAGSPTAPQSRPLMGVLPTANQQGLTAGVLSPSDSTGSIGPNHYIEMINTQVGLFDRTLTAASQTVSLATFVAAPAGMSTGDPQIQWDQQGNRWIYAVLMFNTATPDFRIAFGWSKTPGDPTVMTLNNTDWCNFNVDNFALLYDYPKLGHDANYIEIGANVFPNGGNTFSNSALMAIVKPAPTDTTCTAPPAVNIFNLGASFFTPVPSNTTDASATGYTVAVDVNVIGVWHFSKTPVGTCATPPCLITDGSISINGWSFASSGHFLVPQPGGKPSVDALEGRLTQAVQQSDPNAKGLEAVWTQHTTGSASGRTVVTWYELIPAYCSAGACPVIAKRQEGTLSSPTLYLFNAAISPTSRGDAAVIHYNTGSATTFIDARAQRRDGADPLNSMSGELTLVESTVADNDFSCTGAYGGPPCRWGDYAGASPDPTNPCTVWGTTTISGSTDAIGGKPTWVTQNFALAEGMVQSTVSTQQYVLSGSDGKTWVDMDASRLLLGATRCASSSAVITANADLFTSIAGVNQDIAIFVDADGVPATAPLAWKESGGFNGTFSPNAAYVQAAFPVSAGHSYAVRVKWKANIATSGSIYSGAGPLAGGGYSPTRLTIQYFATAPQTQSTTTQPKLTGNNGSTWSPIPGVASVSITPVANSRVLFGGNADLWTDTAGINQDIGIMLNGTLIAWKESGGFAGTFSPNAAFVQATANLTATQTYTAQLVWKTNIASPAGASIYAGAGPLAGGAFSPTSLFAFVYPAGTNPSDVVTTSQLSLFNSDGATWGAMNVQLAVLSAVSRYAVVGANADLWTQAAGYNQDLAIFVTDNGGPAQLLAWKESGGFGGTYSPNAAFAEVVVSLTAGHKYVFSLYWKTNRPAFGSIFVGAGPISGAFSPTRLLVNLI